MRIAALQCNYEDGKNLAVVAKWKSRGFNVEQLFHPMADSYSALFDLQRHGEILARYLEESHRAGIRVILYLNVHIIGPSHAHRREEWAQRSRDGGWPLFYDTYHPCCFTGPWRDHFFGVLDSLADVDVDGVFLDGPAMADGGCWCPACRAAFDRKHGSPLEGADAKARQEFYTGQRSEFLTLSYRRFKALKPEAVFYINLPVTNPAASYTDIRDALSYNDIVGSEGGFLFYGPARKAFLWKPGVRARLIEAIAPDRPRVIFMAADHKPWSWYPNTPVETRLCIASSSANGASIWWGLHGSTRLLPTPGARAASDMVRFLARHEEHYTAARSAARVAVLHSYDTERERGAAVEASDFYGTGAGAKQEAGSFAKSFEGFADALCRWSIPWDAVTDLDLSADRLAAYDLLVLPTCSCLSDGAVAAVRAFVERGGNLAATFDVSRFDERGAVRAEPGLADVLGIRTTGTITGYRDFNYFEFGAACRAAHSRAARGEARRRPGDTARARAGLRPGGRARGPTPWSSPGTTRPWRAGTRTSPRLRARRSSRTGSAGARPCTSPAPSGRCSRTSPCPSTVGSPGTSWTRSRAATCASRPARRDATRSTSRWSCACRRADPDGSWCTSSTTRASRRARSRPSACRRGCASCSRPDSECGRHAPLPRAGACGSRRTGGARAPPCRRSRSTRWSCSRRETDVGGGTVRPVAQAARSHYHPPTVNTGKLVRLNRIFAHPSGRLCSVAVDHFAGYDVGLPAGLRHMGKTLEALVAGGPDAVTMHRGIAATFWQPFAGRVPLIVQSSMLRPDDSAMSQAATPEDAVRVGADAFAVVGFMRGPTEAHYLRVITESVREAARFEMPVICHIYPRTYAGGKVDISFAPEDIAWAAHCAIECGVDVVKVPYCGDVKAYAQIVADCPVRLVAAGRAEDEGPARSPRPDGRGARRGRRGRHHRQEHLGLRPDQRIRPRLQGRAPRRADRG